MDAGILRRPEDRPAARLEQRIGPGLRVGVGRALGALRAPAVRAALRCGDPVRVRRLPRLAVRRAALGAAGARAQGAAGLLGGVHAGRAGAARRRAVPAARGRDDARADRGDPRQGVLPRRARREARGARRRVRRRDDARGPRRAHERLGRDDHPGLPRLHRARDPAERPGHRLPDGARHAAALRRREPAGRLARQRAPADRGGEARLRRRAPLRRRRGGDGREAGCAARPRLPRLRARA